MSNLFTPNRPPKSGISKKIWDWVISETGKEPDALFVQRLSRYQVEDGLPSYIITIDRSDYMIYKNQINHITNMSFCNAEQYGGRPWYEWIVKGADYV